MLRHMSIGELPETLVAGLLERASGSRRASCQFGLRSEEANDFDEDDDFEDDDEDDEDLDFDEDEDEDEDEDMDDLPDDPFEDDDGDGYDDDD